MTEEQTIPPYVLSLLETLEELKEDIACLDEQVCTLYDDLVGIQQSLPKTLRDKMD